MFFYVVSQKTSAKNSIFDSDKKTQIINISHNKLTQSFKLNKDIIYNDTLNKSSINFYYINSPNPDYTLYIKCPSETISQKYIQIFDSTYRELKYKLQKKSSYLCINLNTPLSDMSDKTCIYISIGNTSTANNKIYILYTKPEKAKLKSNTQKGTTQKFQNSHKPNSEKNSTTKHSTSNKSKTGDKIKKTQTSKNTNKKHNNVSPKTTNSNNHKINKATQIKTPRTQPVKINIRKNKKPKITTKKHTAKTNTKNHTANSHSKKNTATRNKHKTNKNTSNNKQLKLKGISLSKHYILLKKENSLYLNFATQPANLHGYKCIWTTTNPKVASVSFGKITAKSSGLAIIKLKVIHNKVVKTSTCTVRVTI